ncbi:MAG TPA: class I SAM-dependent methyltransferase [Candidatus Kapabacteria bacterium]|nr:class I SAM-dependent methyltransferase [Candidatus Kapabacteria bacterium]
MFHLTSMTHWIIQQYIQQGDTVIDATCGNGHDTLFLSESVGQNGHVFAFDIQESACKATEKILQDNATFHNVTIFNQSHDSLYSSIHNQFHGHIMAVMFNLGYLPQSDKSIITQPHTTYSAIEQSCSILQSGGVITIAVYVEHNGGKDELQSVKNILSHLPSSNFSIAHLCYPYKKRSAPELFVIYKRG